MSDLEKRFWLKVEKTDGCWLWKGALHHNKKYSYSRYGRFLVNGKNEKAHRLAYLLAFGSIRKGYWVLHRCDNTLCVRPTHLFTGTPKDNSRDMVAKGRHWTQLHPELVMAGERHPNARFSEQQIREIRSSYADGEKQDSLATRFKTSQAYVSSIVLGKSWKNI